MGDKMGRENTDIPKFLDLLDASFSLGVLSLDTQESSERLLICYTTLPDRSLRLEVRKSYAYILKYVKFEYDESFSVPAQLLS